jgi:hypothetical protein
MAYYADIITVKIRSGESTSERFALEHRAVCGIFGLAAFEGTAFGFQVSADQGMNWQLLEDADGEAIVVPMTVNEARALSPLRVMGWPFIRLMADANQSAERAVKLLVREV